MADSEKPKDGRPESPTTARELDFDDDEPASHPQTPAKATHNDTEAAATATSTTPAATAPTTTSAQPNRTMTPREQAELTLREAFPSIEPGVVKAVLAASGGQIEPAFNALLGMSDPDAQTEAAPPPPQQPPRPAAPAVAQGQGTKNQLEADELYARQLAEHYQQQDMRRAARGQGDGRPPQQQGYYEEEERERNFIDDDLPEIGENIRKGFIETQQKFNGWLNTLKKKIDGDEENDAPALPARRGPDPRAGSSSRRSNDYDRYDADPEEFDSDFSKLQMRDETASPPNQPPRPGANPNLFKPTPALPSDGRKVSFQDGPPEEIGGTPDPTKRPSSTTNKSKWQPLAAADPTPVDEHDPFTVGDSEDEDTKKDIKPDDAKKLEKAMAEAAGDDIGGSEKKAGGEEKSKT